MASVWNSDSCCSFAALSDSPTLLLTFLVGIIISSVIIVLFKIDGSSNPIKARTTYQTTSSSDNGKCKFPNCIRCSLKSKADAKSEILKKWMLYLQQQQHPDKHLRVVDEAVTSFLNDDDNKEDGHPEGSLLSVPTVFSVRNLQSHPWWDSFRSVSHERDLSLLANRAQSIKAEFLQVDRKYLMTDHQSCNWTVNVNCKWRMFHLMNQGTYVEENCDQCPATYEVLRKLESCMEGCIFGYASFSVVKPGASLRSHTGPTNLRLRCHLGLTVSDNCELIVAGQTRSWTEEQCLVFDDSFYHSVTNRGNQARAVLLVDMWHPDLTLKQRNAIKYLFPSAPAYPMPQELH